MEPWWNFGGTLPQTTPDHPQPSQNLVQPWWNPRGTLPHNHPDHPAVHAEPELCWNPRGTLVDPYLRAAPEPPRSLSGLRPQSFQLLGKKWRSPQSLMVLLSSFSVQNARPSNFVKMSAWSVKVAHETCKDICRSNVFFHGRLETWSQATTTKTTIITARIQTLPQLNMMKQSKKHLLETARGMFRIFFCQIHPSETRNLEGPVLHVLLHRSILELPADEP